MKERLNELKTQNKMKQRDLPEKYKTCDWLWNYGSIGLTKEHIKRLNNAINILESVYEYTDAKYLKEIKDKLLEDADCNNTFVEKACEYLKSNCQRFILTEKDINDFKEYMKVE